MRAVEITVEGRDLWQLYDYIHQHRMPLVMVTARVFAGNGDMIVTGATFKNLRRTNEFSTVDWCDPSGQPSAYHVILPAACGATHWRAFVGYAYAPHWRPGPAAATRRGQRVTALARCASCERNGIVLFIWRKAAHIWILLLGRSLYVAALTMRGCGAVWNLLRRSCFGGRRTMR
jgi:hypothetical protein